MKGGHWCCWPCCPPASNGRGGRARIYPGGRLLPICRDVFRRPLPDTDLPGMADDSSLWTAGSTSLLGDRRAQKRGDILTVVVEIDDQAQISNTTDRSRSGSETMGMPSLFGLPQIIDPLLPEGASMGAAVGVSSNSTFSGDGSVARNEQLTLRVAATVVEELPNGVLRIEGQQEVRVNFELRELIVPVHRPRTFPERTRYL